MDNCPQGLIFLPFVPLPEHPGRVTLGTIVPRVGLPGDGKNVSQFDEFFRNEVIQRNTPNTELKYPRFATHIHQYTSTWRFVNSYFQEFPITADTLNITVPVPISAQYLERIFCHNE